MKKRLLAVVLALAMVLAYMPLMASAEGGSRPEPTGVVYSGATIKYVNTDYTGFMEEGNKLTVSYKDGSSKEFIYKIYKTEKVGDGYSIYGEYFLNGDVNSETAEVIDELVNGKLLVTYREMIPTDAEGGETEVKVSTEVPAVQLSKPLEVEYKGTALRYEPDDDSISNLYNDGNKLIVSYEDGSKRTYICKKYGKDDAGYFLDGNITKNSSGEYDDVIVSFDYVKRPLGTTKVKLTYQEPISFSEDYFVTFTVPLKYIIYSDTKVYSAVGAKNAFTAKWNKDNGKVNGYEVQYSTSKSFKNAKKKAVAGKKKTSVKITKLKAKKKYYVRIRTYRTYKGKKYYSEWSKAKTVKTK